MISAYVKPTNRCNVGCSHCYLPEHVRMTSARMEMSVLRRTAEFLKDMQERQRQDGTLIIWHGGEPLVMPVDWYWEAGAILDEVLPGHRQTMQTSLIPFRQEHVEFVRKRLGAFLGSSVDFSQRKLNGSVEEYHSLFMKKVDLARDNGITIAPGVVPSTNDLGHEVEIVNWFVDRGFNSFNIDRYNAYEAHFPDRPNNAEHSRFLSGLLDALLDRLETHGTTPVVGTIRAGIAGVLHGVPGDRWGGSCMSDFVVVEPDGGLNNCPDKASIEENLAHVDAGYAGFAGSLLRRKWIRHQAVGHQNHFCLGCENFHFCKTGCPITPNDPVLEGGECSGYRSFLTHVRTLANTGKRELLDAYLAMKRTRDAEFSAYDQALAASSRSSGAACVA